MTPLCCYRVWLAALGICLAGDGLQAATLGSKTNPFEQSIAFEPANRIDQLTSQQWAQYKIEPAPICSDAVFVRRVYLDLIGTLPTAAETRAFLLDANPNKRKALIDALLARPEFAEYWTMKWSDLLRVKAEFPMNLWPNAAQAYHAWIRASVRENKPCDQFARELITASGSNFRVPQVNFYRAVQTKEPMVIAQSVALVFMGTRLDKWPKQKANELAVIFSKVAYKNTSEWKEEIVYFNPAQTNAWTGAAPLEEIVLPDGKSVRLAPDQDPRTTFADWLVDRKNPWFSRALANRVWFWLFGRGIVHEPDDIRPDNPASHRPLLVYLEAELVSAHYDLKQLIRLIVNSNTYQLSSRRRTEHPQPEGSFAYYTLRRLEAEVLIDALNQVTGTFENYSSAIPEPFTVIPEHYRATALPDGSITSSFLELFGRPPRDTGLASERDNSVTAAQRLHLLNSTHIQRKIEQGPNLQALFSSKTPPADILANLYLTILSRFPTQDEITRINNYAQTGRVRPREALIDVAWALINSPEFLYRH